MRRRSVGSESSVKRSQRFSSSADIVAILALNSSRTALTISTVSNVLVALLIAEHLSGRSDLDCRVSEFRVHFMIPMNPRQVHHVPEVPTHERIHLRNGGRRNMLDVSQDQANEDRSDLILAKLRASLASIRHRHYDPYTSAPYKPCQTSLAACSRHEYRDLRTKRGKGP